MITGMWNQTLSYHFSSSLPFLLLIPSFWPLLPIKDYLKSIQLSKLCKTSTKVIRLSVAPKCSPFVCILGKFSRCCHSGRMSAFWRLTVKNQPGSSAWDWNIKYQRKRNRGKSEGINPADKNYLNCPYLFFTSCSISYSAPLHDFLPSYARHQRTAGIAGTFIQTQGFTLFLSPMP